MDKRAHDLVIRAPQYIPYLYLCARITLAGSLSLTHTPNVSILESHYLRYSS